MQQTAQLRTPTQTAAYDRTNASAYTLPFRDRKAVEGRVPLHYELMLVCKDIWGYISYTLQVISSEVRSEFNELAPRAHICAMDLKGPALMRAYMRYGPQRVNGLLHH